MPFFFSLLGIFCLLSRGKDKVSISRKEDGQLCYQLYTETESHNLKDPLLFCTSLVAQLAKNPPVMQKTCVWSLSWADALEKGNTYSSILALRSSGMDSPWGHKETRLSGFHFHPCCATLLYTWKDRKAWYIAVHRITKN